MGLGKWLPCSVRDRRTGKACRESAKYLGVEEDEEGKGKPLLVPLCDEHCNGYDRLLLVTEEHINRYGRF
jgi:hypothetical protein